MQVLEQSTPEAVKATAQPGYGISEWPDTHQLYRRFAELVGQPVRPIKRENMPRVLGYFETAARARSGWPPRRNG